MIKKNGPVEKYDFTLSVLHETICSDLWQQKYSVITTFESTNIILTWNILSFLVQSIYSVMRSMVFVHYHYLMIMILLCYAHI